MKKIPPLLIPLLALTSCTGGNSSSETSSFNPDLPYYNRNGELLSLEVDTASTYDAYVRVIRYTPLLNLVANGHSVVLFLYSYTCSHCESFKDAMMSYLVSSQLEVYSLDPNTLYGQIQGIRATNENWRSAFLSVSTPSIYLLQDYETAVELELPTERNDPSAFSSFMAGQLNLSPIYDFTSFSSYSSFIEENEALVYFSDGSSEESSFYFSSLYETAKTASKPLVRVQLDRASDEDLASFSTYLGEAQNKIFLSSEGVESAISYLDEKEGAEALISSYYSETESSSLEASA